MRILSIPVLASALLASAAFLTGPALAQNTATPQANTQAGGQAAHSPKQMESQLRQSLEKSGFKNIRIRPEAYVVHAQAPDGAHLVMMIGPDEVREVISGSSRAPMRGRQGGAMQNGQSGAAQNGQSSGAGQQ